MTFFEDDLKRAEKLLEEARLHEYYGNITLQDILEPKWGDRKAHWDGRFVPELLVGRWHELLAVTRVALFIAAKEAEDEWNDYDSRLE